MMNNHATAFQSKMQPGSIEAVAERRARVFEMRKTGMRIQDIAIEEGITANTVHDDIKTVLMELREYRLDMAMDYVILELERLDALQVAIWAAAENGHLPSQDRVLQIMKQRASLLGLDAPIKLDIFSQNNNQVEVKYINDWRNPEQSEIDSAVSSPGSIDSASPSSTLQLASGRETLEENHPSDANRGGSSS